MSNIFDAVPFEVRKEIHTLELREFGDIMYHSDSKVCVGKTKWLLDPGKWRKQRLHFLHLIYTHIQMDTLLHIVLRDKQMDNYKLFIWHEELKRIMRDIRYDMDDIVVRLNNLNRMIHNLKFRH